MRVECDFLDLRFRLAGLTVERWCQLTGVTPRTVARWQAEGSAPAWAVLLCRLMGGCVDGLPAAGPSWAGWRVVGDALYGPDGESVTLGEVRAVPWQRQLVAEYQLQDRLRRSGPPAAVIPLPVQSARR